MESVTLFFKVMLWILASQSHLPLSKVSEYSVCIAEASEAKQVEPELIVAIITRESGWKETAQSKSADYGFGQIHYRAKGRYKVPDLHEYRTLMDGCSNIHLVADFLSKYGLKGYNPGSSFYVDNTLKKVDRLRRIIK